MFARLCDIGLVFRLELLKCYLLPLCFILVLIGRLARIGKGPRKPLVLALETLCRCL